MTTLPERSNKLPMWQVVCGLGQTINDGPPRLLSPVRRIAVHSYEVAVEAFEQCSQVYKIENDDTTSGGERGVENMGKMRWVENERTGLTILYYMMPVSDVLRTRLRSDLEIRNRWTIGSGPYNERVCKRGGANCDIIDCRKCPN